MPRHRLCRPHAHAHAHASQRTRAPCAPAGLGPDAQEQLQVGVGALAGSTIMLLTIPWGGCILVGGVPIGKSGDAAYGRKAIAAAQTKSSSDYIANLNSYGVTPDSTIQENAKLMVGTALCYLLIQGPAFQYAKGPAKGETPDELNEVVAGTEHWWSLAGLVASVALFFYYVAKMMQQSGEGLHQDKIDGAVVKQLESNQVRKGSLPVPRPRVAQAGGT